MNPKDLVGAKKAPLRYVPPALPIAVSAVMETGARKYGPFNWREQPVSAVTYAEAMLRHIYAWLDGQDVAEDSGLSHIAHVAAGAGILLDATANGTLLDDRFHAGPAADLLRALDKTQSPLMTPSVPVIDLRSALEPPCDWARTGVHSEACIATSYDHDEDEHPADAAAAFGVVPEPWGAGDGPVVEAGR